MNRRSFFTRIAKAVVIAAAAPILIREVIAAELTSKKLLNLQELHQCVFDLMRARRARTFEPVFDIVMDRYTVQKLRDAGLFPPAPDNKDTSARIKLEGIYEQLKRSK
jgi:hypothetical protein